MWQPVLSLSLTIYSLLILFTPGIDGLFTSKRRRNQPLAFPFKAPHGPAVVGEPLFLTPYIKSGRLEEGRRLARVANFLHVESYSGYLTVNPKYNSNIFFWFFPAARNPSTAPVLVWLQGGPGSSSLFGLFVENGPFRVNRFKQLELRTTSWARTHNVIYFDNPVGAGFSFTEDDAGYTRNEKQAARDLYSALTQFFTLFPQYASLDFYLTGESYAGKHIPVLAYKIHTENEKKPKVNINLKGFAVGGPFSDPKNLISVYGRYLYNLGLLDEKQLAHFNRKEQSALRAIKNKRWTDAFHIIDNLLDADFGNISYYQKATGLKSYYNALWENNPPEFDYYIDFLEEDHVRRSLHVGNRTYRDQSPEVEKDYIAVFYKGVVPVIVKLLEAQQGYKVLFYAGQFDVIVPNTGLERMLKKMRWSGSAEYAKCKKEFWRVGQDLAGYVRRAKNFTYLLMREAGHMAPYDQPQWAYDMINRFTSGTQFA